MHSPRLGCVISVLHALSSHTAANQLSRQGVSPPLQDDGWGPPQCVGECHGRTHAKHRCSRNQKLTRTHSRPQFTKLPLHSFHTFTNTMPMGPTRRAWTHVRATQGATCLVLRLGRGREATASRGGWRKERKPTSVTVWFVQLVLSA